MAEVCKNILILTATLSLCILAIGFTTASVKMMWDDWFR